MPKTRPKIEKIIKEYGCSLKTLGIRPQKFILYGSYAKNKQREGSDIDLLVISEDFQNLNLRERTEVLGMAAARIMQPIEARGYTPQEIKQIEEASFLKEILETGILFG